MPVDLRLPDGQIITLDSGSSGADAASEIGPGLARAAVAVKLNGNLQDLAIPITESGDFEVVTLSTDEGLEILRHSSAHVLAQAVLDLYQGSTFAIGPPIEDGFYYDFEVASPFTPDDLERIEARMLEIVSEDQPFERVEMTREEALDVFADHKFKVEIIESVDPSEVGGGESVSAYENNGFIDLCRGPHLPSTGRIPAVRLLRTAGAYWRGDESREQLQRVYGTAWPSSSELAAYLERQEQARLRDHRKLGPELDLFSFPDELGAGLAVWHPKGGILRRLVDEHSRRLHDRFGFETVVSPHLAKADLWRTSGHLDYYAENMYPGMELDNGQGYRVKPMNCPFHVLIYKSRGRSYRDLPLRLGELGAVYRYEMSGVLHGLMRARGFTQDDSHTFCTGDQLASELRHHLDLTLRWWSDFGFTDVQAELATRPEKSVGEPSRWDLSEKYLREALSAAGITFRVGEGEGAFYGPKIDFHVGDAVGRQWQMGTIQLDFTLPERFDLTYTGPENRPEHPYMIHCAKAGSMERFIGVLVEHYAGAFPMWLSPVQAMVVPVADRHEDYARQVVGRLEEAGLRAEAETSTETVGDKIRRALSQKVPSVLVVGDDDVEAGTVGLRLRGDERDTRGVPLSAALETLLDEAAPPA